MAKTTKKKSATYKLNYYDAEGKRRCKTFSAPTRRMAKDLAEEWKDDHLNGNNVSLTVLEAFNAYIDLKAPVLSPSTVRSYKGIVRSRVENNQIGSKPVKDLTLVDVQRWINEEVMKDLSPKTVKDHYSLLRSVIEMQSKHLDFSAVALPQQKKFSGHTPTDTEIKTLINYAKGLDSKDLYYGILLSAFGPLRRSEACAITDEDINGNMITINKAVVKNQDNGWTIKTTKTVESTRVIDYPAFVIKEISGIKGNIIKCNPDALGNRFKRAVVEAGLPHFRFHDLRHYGASIMHSLNVPDIYIMKRGGWATDAVLRRVYINSISDEQKKQNKIINTHFEALV